MHSSDSPFLLFFALLPFAPFSFAISDRRKGFFLSSVRASSSLERSTRGYLSFDLFVNAKFHAGSSAWKVGHLIKMANPFEVSVWRSKKIEDLPFFVRVRVFDYLIRNYRFLRSGKYKNALKYTNLLMFLTPQIFILSFFLYSLHFCLFSTISLCSASSVWKEILVQLIWVTRCLSLKFLSLKWSLWKKKKKMEMCRKLKNLKTR